MAAVTELITKFSFVGSEAPLTKYNASLGKSVAILGAFTIGAFAAGAAVAKWATDVLGAEQPLINLSNETGIAVEKIQELSFVASVSNSSVGALTSSLAGLTDKIGDAAQKGSEDFSRLGISIRDANGEVKTADTVLDDIRTRFRQLNLSMGEQRSFANALGIDPSLVTLLNRTDSEMASLTQRARELGTLNAEQAKQAQEYNDSITALRFGFDGLRRLVAVGLAPELMRMAETFTDLLTENRDWIINGVRFGLGVLNDFTDFLGRMWPILSAGIAIFVALKVATIGWGAVLAVVLSPVVLITAGIVALLFAIDDLMVGLQGGDSLIRDFFQSFFDYDIANLFTDWTNAVQGFLDKVMSFPDWVKDLFGGGANVNVTSQLGSNRDIPASNSTVNQQVRMEIKTSDPERAGQVVADKLQEQMTDAQTQSRRGGR